MDTTPTTNITGRWLLLAAAGLGMLVLGLFWDATMHASDPRLAAEEGPLTLANPSHTIAAIGLAMAAIGVSSAVWSQWRPAAPIRTRAAASLVLAAGALTVLGAWALGSVGNDPHEPSAGAAEIHGHETPGTSPMGVTGFDATHGRHTTPPFAERLAAATPEERAAADSLFDATRITLDSYQDPAAAVAAGYTPPRSPKGALWHYANRALIDDPVVLDPEQPEGLVYYTMEGEEPVLLGAFFIAPPGTEAPTPAGDLVIWHSHSERCPGFLATEAEPCELTGRILHVWTADEVSLTSPGTDRLVDVAIADPFGVPFVASITVLP